MDDGTDDLQPASNWHSSGRAWKHPTVVIDWYGDYERTFTQDDVDTHIDSVQFPGANFSVLTNARNPRMRLIVSPSSSEEWIKTRPDAAYPPWTQAK